MTTTQKNIQNNLNKAMATLARVENGPLKEAINEVLAMEARAELKALREQKMITTTQLSNSK